MIKPSVVALFDVDEKRLPNHPKKSQFPQLVCFLSLSTVQKRKLLLGNRDIHTDNHSPVIHSEMFTCRDINMQNHKETKVCWRKISWLNISAPNLIISVRVGLFSISLELSHINTGIQECFHTPLLSPNHLGLQKWPQTVLVWVVWLGWLVFALALALLPTPLIRVMYTVTVQHALHLHISQSVSHWVIQGHTQALEWFSTFKLPVPHHSETCSFTDTIRSYLCCHFIYLCIYLVCNSSERSWTF